MSSTFEDIKETAAQLTELERAERALALKSLDGLSDADVEEVWRIEVERRLGQSERGEVQLFGKSNPNYARHLQNRASIGHVEPQNALAGYDLATHAYGRDPHRALGRQSFDDCTARALRRAPT